MSSDPKALLAAKFLDSFLREIVLDTAIHTHAKLKRARSICHLCGVRCQAHNPAAQPSSSSSSSNFAISSDTSTPSRSGTPAPGSSTSASHKPDYYSNNPLFECLVCSRQVSSNRYATHLAKCMGMGSKGGRKGAARNAKAATSVLTSSSRQSGAGTPRYSSDLDDDSFSKRKNGNVVSKNGTKRASSPLAASTLANARMNKRLKTSSPTPPPAESVAGGLNRSYSSQTFAPSGLSSSTVISGSPLNPNNNIGSTSKADASLKSKNGATYKKRKRFVDDDDDHQDDDGGVRYHDASAADSNGEEGEISDDDDDDDDDDVALATANSSQPPASRTKIKIPIRATSSSSASASTSKPKTFIVADDSDDSDTNLSNRHKVHTVSDDDDEVDDDDDDDDDAEDDDDDDDDDDEDDDDDDDVQVTRVTHPSMNGTNGASGGGDRKKKSSAANGSGLQRERGSDGEFIDVESASEQSDADSF